MNKPRILSIDDETSFTDLIKQYFQPRGYKITSVSDGAQGLDILQTEEYDVVLANPPFTGSIDVGDVHDALSLNTSKTELLFLELF